MAELFIGVQSDGQLVRLTIEEAADLYATLDRVFGLQVIQGMVLVPGGEEFFEEEDEDEEGEG